MRANHLVHLAVVMLVTSVAACVPTAPADNTAEARAGIEATNARFMAAAGAGDGAGIAAAYTADAQIFPPGSPPLTGRSAIADFFQSALDAGVSEVVLETDEAEGHGSTAHEIGRYQMKTEDGSVLDRGHYVVVWKQVDGDWRLHRDIWSSELPPPGAAAEAGAGPDEESG